MEPSNPTFSTKVCLEKEDTHHEVTNVVLPLDTEEEDVGGLASNTSYGFVPISFTEMTGEGKQLLFVQNEIESHSESVTSQQQVQEYRYAIDKSTGNLLIIQDYPNSNIGENAAQTTTTAIPSSSLSGDTLALLQVLDDGHCVLEASSEQLTFHSAEDINPDEDEGISRLHDGGVINVGSGSSNDTQHKETNEAPLRRALWSRRKIADFIQCIHSHEQKFKKCSKIRGNIWNDISKDMIGLGHHDCNKDECSKKWNNLYRTWKKVKLRPKEDRHKWQYFHQISNLVKAISQREKNNSSLKKSKPSTQELILQLIEQNRKHQETILATEEKFQNQVSLLNNERDEILHGIRIVLESQ